MHVRNRVEDMVFEEKVQVTHGTVVVRVVIAGLERDRGGFRVIPIHCNQRK